MVKFNNSARICPNYKPGFDKHLRQKTQNGFNYEHLSPMGEAERSMGLAGASEVFSYEARSWSKVGSSFLIWRNRQLVLGTRPRSLQFSEKPERLNQSSVGESATLR